MSPPVSGSSPWLAASPGGQHVLVPGGAAYSLLMMTGILVAAVFWYRRVKGEPQMLAIFAGALGGAFAGAKLAYLLAEGWADFGRADVWLRLATGKSVVGGLLGAYGGVEVAKALLGHRASTGDTLVLVLPVSLLLGRLGCWLNGCCLGNPMPPGVFAFRDAAGVPRWPAPLAEGGFQLFMLGVLLVLKRRGLLRDRLFFLYLASYGAFRFAHEFLRATPKLPPGLSGYQWLSLAMVGLGLVMLMRRGRQRRVGTPPTSNVEV